MAWLQHRAWVSRNVAAVVMLATGVTASCSTGSATTTVAGAGTANVATSGDFLAAYTTKICDAYKPCCAAAGLRSDGAVCLALINAFLKDPTLNGATYSPGDGSACIGALEAQVADGKLCADGSTTTAASESPDACRNAYTYPGGKRAPGETCRDTFECAAEPGASVSCTSSTTTGPSGTSETTRTCRAKIWGQAGEGPCNATVTGSSSTIVGDSKLARAYRCDRSKGLYCNGTTKACTALGAIGSDCTSGTTCVEEATCTKNKCTARTPIGSACDGTLPACVVDAYCDRTAKTCAATQPAGAACTQSEQCASTRCVNKVCEKQTQSLALVCGS